MMKKEALLTTIIFILSFAAQGICMDYYVDVVNGSEENAGTAVDDAWKTITHALIHVLGTDADPAAIHVAPGMYDTTNGESFPLALKNNVSLKGADKESTILDGSEVSASIIAIKGIENVKIESLTITGGKGTEGKGHVIEGGGISFEDSYNIVIEDCIIRGNSADFGGGICFMGSGYPNTYNKIKTIVTNCVISDNSAGFGGGIFSDYRTDLTISYCTIRNNTSNSCGGGINCKSAIISYCDITENSTTSPYGYCGGAGIYLENQFGVIIQNCKINSNSTASTGGGIGSMSGYGVSIIDSEIIGNSSLQGGGGIYLSTGGSINEISGCVIMDNTSQKSGGAICFYTFWIEPLEADPPDNIATLSMTNTLISGNEAKKGSIISTADQLDMINCTIADNASTTLGIKLVNSLDYLKAKNCIFWGNGSFEGIDGIADIKYSDVESGYGGKGNIDADP
ncbi:right-handed parallel beta-helix repeat-containing protein, partial [bacterium]|nr:right-handed parallel beta-helix repeat-containing protein [bacterium]